MFPLSNYRIGTLEKEICNIINMKPKFDHL